MKLKRFLLKQSKPRIWLGGARDMMQRGQSYYGMISIVINLATLYTVREAMIKHYFPWINFFIVVMFVLVAAIIVMIIDHKVVYPSQIAFHQYEAWKHRSPIRQAMEEDRQANLNRMTQIERDINDIKISLRQITGKDNTDDTGTGQV